MASGMTKREMAHELNERLKTAKPSIRPTTKQFMNMTKSELTRWYKKAKVVKSRGETNGDIEIR